MKNIYFLTLSVILLIGCEGHTNRNRVVSNNSSSTIWVNAQTEGNMFVDSIGVDQSALLFSTSQLGGTDIAENPSNGISYLLILNRNGDTIQKDYTIQSNWEMNINQIKKRPSEYEHIYTFPVFDDDF